MQVVDGLASLFGLDHDNRLHDRVSRTLQPLHCEVQP